ncbi:MAG TPA: arginine decarboxylase, pyruvoyl-dependent [Thermopetrobacter sp.]|nr:arginine decarboxylase, pyruvoyl-dependent [Thermopetrobacter sp.]
MSAAGADERAPALFVPSAYFLVSGTGDAERRLVAFDLALLRAGVADVNLVRLSSIVGPRARRIAPVELMPGALVPTAYAQICGETAGERIAAAVAVAHPDDATRAGVIMEFSHRGTAAEAEEIVRDMAAEAIANRGLKVARMESIAAEHVVERAGCAFAGVVQI